MADDTTDDLGAFLVWFKSQTEAAWARHRTTPIEEFKEAGAGGRSWRSGTEWQPGLAADEIDAIEERWDVRFPPPYRTFLSILNAPDRGMYSVGWADDESEELVEVEDEPSFYDWQRDSEELTCALKDPLDGLLFDVEHNDLWPKSWGTKPQASQVPARLAELVAAAPALIPVYGHRYLLDHKVGDDYPVLSVQQADIIFYGSNLRNYLLLDLDGLIGPTPGVTFEAANSAILKD
ncbi:MAG: SMI1/KNR4 family protein, partial [Rhizobiales bacterium]|nr:SMI1/KNR4 family protein [Hyphomicrobiales bacterium]